MKYKTVKKMAVIVSWTFIVLSIIEIVFGFIITLTQLTFNGGSINLASLMLDSSRIPLKGVFLWIFLNGFILMYFSLGALLILKFRNSPEKNLVKQEVISKGLVLAGIFVLILTFIKFNYMIIFGNTQIDGEMGIQRALYDPSISPVHLAPLWIFFTAVSCYYLIIGLAFTAVSLYWTLELEKKSEKVSEIEEIEDLETEEQKK